MTGISTDELLRASHIVPWARCESDEERLNVHNGLLLSSLWDAAFDVGLITFDDHGQVIGSPRLREPERLALNLEGASRLILTDEHRVRLAWHRRMLWQAE